MTFLPDLGTLLSGTSLLDSHAEAVEVEQWNERLNVVRFTHTDIKNLCAMRPCVEEILDDLVLAFYSHLTNQSRLLPYLSNPQVIERLKIFQRNYILELFCGVYDQAYAQRRAAIGTTHERLGIEPHWYLCSYGIYFERLVPHLVQRLGGTAGSAISALCKILLLDMSIATNSYVNRFVRQMREMNQQLMNRVDLDEDLLETISDTSIDAILTLNASGHILFWNRATEQILGLGAVELEGRKLEDLLRKRTKQEIPERLRALNRFELTYAHPSGDAKTLIVSSAALRDDRHEDVRTAVILRDITEKRRLQERITVMEKISAMARVSGAIAHEIRTPLGALLLQTDLLDEHLDAMESNESWRQTARDLVADLAMEADRLNNIVSDYLSMLRLSRISPQETYLGEYMSRVEQELRRRLEDWPISLTFHIPDNLPLVRIDQDQLRRVFLNLFTNAVEATNRQGHLVFGAKTIENGIEIYVEDDGPGIAPQDREQVLEPFYTTKSAGTGLGLYLVNQIVTAHGGRLRIEENQPTGARIVLLFPSVS